MVLVCLVPLSRIVIGCVRSPPWKSVGINFGDRFQELCNDVECRVCVPGFSCAESLRAHLAGLSDKRAKQTLDFPSVRL